MSVFKQVHMKFWQNDFVLGLTAEERYFYIYLITNSMTNQCGIYKFNRRLAELETGYAAEKIEIYLKKFQDYGKITISQTSTEIMLANWFKHNFKSNKKSILLINKELKDVKDKTLLKSLYDSCSDRQYPIADIFRGVIIPDVEIEKSVDQEEALPAAVVEIEKNANTDFLAQVEGELEVSPEPSEKSTTSPVFLADDTGSFMEFKMNVDNPPKRKSKKGKPIEELVTNECLEEDKDEIVGGTIEAVWSFAEEAKAEAYSAAIDKDDCSISDALISNTA